MLSITAEYALRIMVVVAEAGDRPTTSERIAELTNVPPDYSVKVFDLSKEGSKVVWSKTPPTYEFPKNGRFRDTTSEAKFQRAYIHMLAQKISRHFYAYPYADDVATDALSIDI